MRTEKTLMDLVNLVKNNELKLNLPNDNDLFDFLKYDKQNKVLFAKNFNDIDCNKSGFDVINRLLTIIVNDEFFTIAIFFNQIDYRLQIKSSVLLSESKLDKYIDSMIDEECEIPFYTLHNELFKLHDSLTKTKFIFWMKKLK